MKKLSIFISLLLFLSVNGFAKKVEKDFVSKMGKTLNIDIRYGGDITVEGWTEDKIKIVVEYDGPDNADFVDYDYYDGDLNISVNLFNISDNIEDIHFLIHVPYKFNIEMETMGGDISVNNIDGEISGKTMGGDLDFSKIYGVIDMTTMGGDISLEEAQVDGSLKTMGGDVDFKNVAGNVKGNSMGGDISYKNVKLNTKGGKVEISTMGGDIEVDEAVDGAIVSTMGGDITIKNAKKFVKAKTMGGDIELYAVDGWIKATTMGGNIEAAMVGNVKEGKRDVNLNSMDGDIELTLPEESSIKFDLNLRYTKNSSRNYKIETNFPIEIKEDNEWTYRNGNATKTITGSGEVNGGKNTIKINTTNGNIIIRAK
jgi:DUF4097 and DUF4098 domain-containing protein YvlB